MYQLKLIAMPFMNVNLPSLALTQLKAIVEERFASQVAVDICYLNHDFAHYFGWELYHTLSGQAYVNTGLGDWIFRHIAFPTAPDNTEIYLKRYYPQTDPDSQQFKQTILAKRAGMAHFLDSLIAQYNLANADLVGFTSMFNQNVACFALAQRLKERKPTMRTVMGGPNCESPMGSVIVEYVDQIDFVFSGPALVNFPEFLGYQLAQQPERSHTIDGVFSKENFADFAYEEDAPENLNGGAPLLRTIGEELPITHPIPLDYAPFLDTLATNFPGRAIEPRLTFETSRGCWWGERSHCTFCGLNGVTMNYRAMTPEHALQQFEALFQYKRATPILLECVDNILPKSYLTEVLPNLEMPSTMTLFYEVKSDLKERDLQVLAKARCRIIQPGIESINTSTLRLMKKGASAFQNIQLLKNCALYDILPVWNLLIGFPGEKAEVFRKYVQDIPLLMHLPPPTGAYPVRFDRYSPYFNQADEYGLDLQPFDFYRLVYPFGEDALYDLAYYFMDHNFSADYFGEMMAWINQINEKIALWQQCWSTSDPTKRAHLYLMETATGPQIHDSRSGQVVEYPISQACKALLQALERATPQKRLFTDFANQPAIDLEKELAFCQAKGLLFQEGERLLSLVQRCKPPYTYAEIVTMVENQSTTPSAWSAENALPLELSLIR